MLGGSLPAGMACGGQLGFVDVSNNRLSGALPSCLSSKSSKRAVRFGGNCLANDPQHQQHEPEYCEAGGAGGEGSRSGGMGLMLAVIGGLSSCRCWFACFRDLVQKEGSTSNGRTTPVVETTSGQFSFWVLVGASHECKIHFSSCKVGTQVLPTYRVFSLEELREATKDFDKSSFLGEGSVGKLYKGRLENGIFVAIRCLELYKRYSIRNLKLRLDLLSKLRHSHLVCLLGHCIDAASNDSDVNMVFLIYEYVPNGNLRAHLFEHSPERVLKWSDRLAVLTGIAKAVHFLHTGIIPGFFNNRLTSNNILLDEHRIVKVSDYGLSIISEEIYKNEGRDEGQKTVRSISPNLKTKDLEDDVYSFGLIILEALVGPSISEKGEEFFLNELAKPCGALEERKGIIDRNVLSTCSQESLSIVLDIMDKCLLPDPSARPSIEDVLWNLQYATQVQTTADGDQRSDLGSQT
ncbi:putative F-box protein [Iris pallida]|uniref:F-box protein n=1 Tax=Iris pallida TaxID=29817 RepID=A0AAX6G8W3_IRIPA|nr:putative F-box protein [Iris pallida]